MNYENLSKQRRTIYALGKNLTQTEHELEILIKSAVRETPSAFNSQSSRVVVLFNSHHSQLWDITKAELKKIVAADQFADTEKRIDSFAAGFGTILFFEDQNVITELQQKFSAYADNFPLWSWQSTGIALYSVWLALAEQGVGASIQHYNPLIDIEVKKLWNIPASWQLTGQMPFGSIEASAGVKEYIDDASRILVFK